MSWTFKTKDEQPVRITNYEEKENPEMGIFYDPDINYGNCGEDRLHPKTGEELKRTTITEYNQLAGISTFEIDLRGNGYPSKSIEMENRQNKALRKNPNHTTMNDYKFSNPDSVPAKSKERNMKRLKKKGVKVKKSESA